MIAGEDGFEDAHEGPAKGIRLQTLIARSGASSRRAAEKMMLAGRVRLNGRIATELGIRAMPGDVVEIDGRKITGETRQHYLALNKPPGYLCAMSDEYGRPLAVSLFNPDIKERVYNIGRLDLDSCGLILFTNDGKFAARVGHPSSGLVKEYNVMTDGRIPPEFRKKFMEGIHDEGEVLTARSVILTGADTCVIQLEEGRNREIRRALAAFSLKATMLRRVAIGPVLLGNLGEGRWRNLSDAELDALNESDAGIDRSTP
jgi:23S rRNA pseudouridine2605 synthase